MVGRETPKVSAISCTVCCRASYIAQGLSGAVRGHLELRAALAQVVQGLLERRPLGEGAGACSTNTLVQPAAVSASVWACGCWSRVETRAYPTSAMRGRIANAPSMT